MTHKPCRENLIIKELIMNPSEEGVIAEMTCNESPTIIAKIVYIISKHNRIDQIGFSW